MAMKSSAAYLTMMAMALSASANDSRSLTTRHSLPKRRHIPREVTPEERLDHLEKCFSKVQKRISDYSEKRPNSPEFLVQGFTIKAINKKNAIKAVKKSLEESGVKGDMDKEFIESHIQRIKEAIGNE